MTAACIAWSLLFRTSITTVSASSCWPDTVEAKQRTQNLNIKMQNSKRKIEEVPQF
jgi:hypothetical protein